MMSLITKVMLIQRYNCVLEISFFMFCGQLFKLDCDRANFTSNLIAQYCWSVLKNIIVLSMKSQMHD